VERKGAANGNKEAFFSLCMKSGGQDAGCGNQPVPEKEVNETYRHAKQARAVMLEIEVLVRKGLEIPDGGRAGAIAVEEITALDHKVFDLKPQKKGCLHVS